MAGTLSSSSIDAAQLASQLSESDKRELQTFIQSESQKASIQESVHSLTAMCFKKCVQSAPRDGNLDRYEEPCISNCVNRFLDANNLVLQHLERMRARG